MLILLLGAFSSFLLTQKYYQAEINDIRLQSRPFSVPGELVNGKVNFVTIYCQPSLLALDGNCSKKIREQYNILAEQIGTFLRQTYNFYYKTIPAPQKPYPTALCRDGTFSYSQNRSGTCSHHGGVATWL